MAQHLVNSISSQINTITKIAAANMTKPIVYYEVWTPPLMSVGATAFINDVIVKAGGKHL